MHSVEVEHAPTYAAAFEPAITAAYEGTKALEVAARIRKKRKGGKKRYPSRFASMLAL